MRCERRAAAVLALCKQWVQNLYGVAHKFLETILLIRSNNEFWNSKSECSQIFWLIRISLICYCFFHQKQYDRDVTVNTFLVWPLRCWAESAPLGWNRVKVSENLGATTVVPVAPAVTSLIMNRLKYSKKFRIRSFELVVGPGEPLQVILRQINIFCPHLTQNMITEFFRFTKIYINWSEIQTTICVNLRM